MIDLIKKLLMKSRTIVTSDVGVCMEIISEKYDIELHKFPTGSEYQTWPVPPEWNVKKAILLESGKVIASYEESPLFLAPYSISFSEEVTRDELIEHTYTNPSKLDAFCYEFRLAYNYQRRLKEWRVTLPYDRVQNLSKDPFQVEIEVETKPGNLIVVESFHTGINGYWFTFFAYYCHVAQANDGLAGAAVMLEAVKRIIRCQPLIFLKVSLLFLTVYAFRSPVDFISKALY